MAVNPSAQFPVYYGNTQAWEELTDPYYGNTQTGGQVYVPGREGHGVNLFNIFGSNFNSWLDPLNIADNYAITPYTPPPAPGFTPGTMPTQKFTNNDFGDFNTPSMRAKAGRAHPGILVQPPAPPPAPPPPAAGNVGGGPVGSNPSNLIGLNSSDFLSKGNTSYGGDTPVPHTGFAHLPPEASYLKSKYGQTPNTAISKGGMSVPSSYNTTTSSTPPRWLALTDGGR